MEINITGPNGETFHAKTNPFLPPANKTCTSISMDEHNARERKAIQKALETWCHAFSIAPPADEGGCDEE